MPSIVKRVVLTLEGELPTGFQVRLELGIVKALSQSGQEAYTPQVEVIGHLPPNPALATALQDWQRVYHRLMQPTRALKPQRIRYDGSLDLRKDCRHLANEVVQQFQDWLQAAAFQALNLRLREELHREEPIQLLIRSRDRALLHLPWHRWDFVERYHQVEVAFSSPEAESPPLPPPRPTAQVRILAILGHSDQIDVERDRALLQQLPQAAVTFLVEPTRSQLTDQLWEQTWDILFFAGHSETAAQTGRLSLNATETITLEDLRYGLRRAIAQGLQLAIFNSCDGLGLAKALGDLPLPHMIVMREPVPDVVAQQFLLYFLQAFAAHQPFYHAVRTARERLQGSEADFPCASWLPAICQSSTASPPTWRELSGGDRHPPRPAPGTALLSGGLVAVLVILARLAGLLQGIELATYDHFMRVQPSQGQDDRLLIVAVTPTDVAAQDADSRKGTSLNDATLEQLLSRLMAHQPRVIALDLFRDFAVEPGHDELVSLLQAQRVITLCSHGRAATEEIPPPPEVQTETPANRLGYSNLTPDQDNVIRRHTLSQSPPAEGRCQAFYSLALLSVKRYLAQQDISLRWEGQPPLIQLRDTVLTPINESFGGYQGVDNLGHQIMLHYRAAPDAVARTVTVGELLNGDVDPSWIEDRLVLIGNTDPSFKDRFQTPLTRVPEEQLYGVHLHAHSASQLLSVVLDGQPLIWSWPEAGEGAWILAWGLVGGGIAWRFRRLPIRVGVGGTALLLLYGGSYGLFWLGGWIPLVPAAIALMGGLIGGAIASAQGQRWHSPTHP